MKILASLRLVLATCAITASTAVAQQLAFNFTSPGTQDNGASFNVTGFRFEVTSPITIYQLAAFNPSAPSGIGISVGDGGGNIRVGLWDDVGTLLTSVTIPQGTLPISSTYFSAVNIATPITLQQGFYRIAGDGYRTWVSGSPSLFTGYTSALDVTYLGCYYNESGYGFAFPNITDAGYSFLNVSFVSSSAVPEPSTYAALVGLGVLGFAAYRRRRVVA